MKVIFLDIDGVMNTSDSWSLPLNQQILDEKVMLLKQIVDKTDAKIAISSSWRSFNRHMDVVNEKFSKYDLYVYSITPRLGGNNQRGDEIRRWLENNPKFDSFVILDDDSDMREYTKTHLIKTDYNIGLTQEQVDKAISILIK